ncbi:MAG: MoaD/ThiS family protein [Candidatus Thermoplasmatota archaeon]|nr:MoaD/ThiS family protein [Candidatus Thermoplasmatota archaeon]
MNQHTMLFFGPLRDQFGAKQKVVEMPENCTLEVLLKQIGVDANFVKVAVNGDIVPLSTKLAVDCEIALLPPVSGG